MGAIERQLFAESQSPTYDHFRSKADSRRVQSSKNTFENRHTNGGKGESSCYAVQKKALVNFSLRALS